MTQSTSPDPAIAAAPLESEADQGAVRIVIVTGRAGAGRRTAINALEDLGFATADTPPLAIAADVIGHFLSANERDVAIGLSAREGDVDDWRAALSAFEEMLSRFREDGFAPSWTVLFLDCADDILIRRYTETRRRHPLARAGAMEDGLVRDREHAAIVRDAADIVIDTTNLTAADLKREVAQRFDRRGGRLTVSVLSFSYRYGLPAEADLVFDCRFLRNPHYVETLRPLDGRDPTVAAYVAEDAAFAPFLAQLGEMTDLLLPAFRAEGKSYLTIAFGCTGGKHRSVAAAEAMAERLRGRGWRIHLRHRERERAAAATTRPLGGDADRRQSPT